MTYYRYLYAIFFSGKIRESYANLRRSRAFAYANSSDVCCVNRPCSYYRCWTGISMQWRLMIMGENIIKNILMSLASVASSLAAVAS